MDGQTHRVTLASIVPWLPPEAVYWLEGLDSLAFTAAQIVLNTIGADDFIDDWKEHRAEAQTVALDFAEPWPANAIKKITAGARWEPSLETEQDSVPSTRQ